MSESLVATLEKISLKELLTTWRPGSHDWSWAKEQQDLLTRDAEKTAIIRQRVLMDGFNFANLHSPILLGSDGRVWDGHHRIILAMEYEPDFLWVDIARKDRDRIDRGSTDYRR